MNKERKEEKTMYKTMKGYGVGSVLERTSYSKRYKDEKISSSRAVLELDVYKKEKDTNKRLCQLIRRKSK